MSTIALEKFREKVRDGYLIYNWLQGPMIGPNFRRAESSFIFGAPDYGKTRLLVRLAKKFRRISNAQLIDVFGAENDSESTVWLLDPESNWNTLMICGNDVKVNGWDRDKIIPVGEFTLEKAKGYDVVITDRKLFGPYDDEKWDRHYYSALAHIFKLCKRREGERRLIVLLIREIWNVVYSVIRAGVSPDEQAAQQEFRKLHNQRYHSKVGMVMDTQRYVEGAASVRTLVDYRYVKGFGSQQVPNELHFLYKPHLFGSIPRVWNNPREYMVRNMPRDHFAVLTHRNGVGLGWYKDISWHIEKGFSPLRKLGITTELIHREDDDQRKANDGFQEAEYLPPVNEIHRLMIELRAKEKTNREIAKILSDRGIPTTLAKVRYHLTRRCSCEVGVTQKAGGESL